MSLNWRRREDHPAEFQEGEELLVATVLDEPPGTARWDLIFGYIGYYHGEPWVVDEGDYFSAYKWSDVVFWVPRAEVDDGLPPLDSILNKG